MALAPSARFVMVRLATESPNAPCNATIPLVRQRRPQAPTTVTRVFEKKFHGALHASDSWRLSVPLLLPSPDTPPTKLSLGCAIWSFPRITPITTSVVLERFMPQLHSLVVLLAERATILWKDHRIS